MFYNFMKYGLVDEVTVFLEDKRIKRGIVQNSLSTDYGPITIKSASDINVDQLEKNQYVYCWSKWEDCEKLKDNFVIVNPMFSGISYPSVIKRSVHDYALIEGSAFEKTVPDWMDFDVFRYTTKDFCEISNKQRETSEKNYDWIMVSSFDPRKRHIEFLTELIKHSNVKKLRGCIVGRSPDNKGHYNTGHDVLSGIQKLKEDHSLDIDIFLNVSQEEKKKLILMSKVFVCSSSLDNGPRAMVEATQAGLPLISMPHIGSSDLITKTTGVLVDKVSNFPDAVFQVLENLKEYDRNYNAKILSPDVVYPRIIQKIRERK
jgi:glycosyltransferase involved in cell wall biosynthesis